MIIEKIKKWLGFSETETDYKSLVEAGAQIIDLRTPAEFSTGHIPNSINIPLALLAKKIGRLDKERQIILCCGSGVRSAAGRNTLQSMGYRFVHDGGSWRRLMKGLKVRS